MDDDKGEKTPKGKQRMLIEEANVAHFNRIAQTGGYDDNPLTEQVSQQIVDTICEEYEDELDEDKTVMLDYACGTGQMSRKLAPYVNRIVGVDISQGMVDYYNQRVYNQGIPEEEMHAVCIPELKGDDSDLDGQKFDLIICAQAYHHFPDIQKMTNNLANLLKPGTGILFVADLMEHDPSIFKHRPPHSSHSHSEDQSSSTSSVTHSSDRYDPLHTEGSTHPRPHPHPPLPLHHHHHHHHHHRHHDGLLSGPTVAHRGGFTSDQIETCFVSAGLQDFRFIDNAASAQMEKGNKHIELFVASGRRPAEGIVQEGD
ncbi:hypothetical protein FRC20_002500 [Serendipita sp. 405]|nr:hypothetical protein FRC20_002500 [Serendipita sp. 405]